MSEQPPSQSPGFDKSLKETLAFYRPSHATLNPKGLPTALTPHVPLFLKTL